MKTQKIFLLVLTIVLALGAISCQAQPAPVAQPPAPVVMPQQPIAPVVQPVAPVAFDIKPVLDKYFAALPDGFGLIAPAAASDQMKATKTFLLDLREVSEITTNGYIEGAVNIPTRTLMKNLDKLPAKDQPIIVMCGSGVRSPLGMASLQMLGYANVKSLTGGFGAWKAANLPVVMGTPTAPMAGMAPTVDKDLLAAFDKWFTALPDGWNGIAPAAASDQMKATKLSLIDVREMSEITANGSIEGSISIPVRTLIKSLDKLPADKTAPIIITCQSGHRGMFSMMALQMLGYTNVKNISGGVNAWKAANLPIVGAPLDLKASFDKYFSALPDGFSLIAPAAASDQMKVTKVFLLDLREASEITTNGYIEGAVNIPTRTLMKNLDKLPTKDQPIIVMCGSGVRSPLGMASLQMLGYTNVKSLTGGFGAWKAANLPVVMGAPAAPVAGKAPEVDKDLLAAFDKWFTALPDGWNGIAPAAAKDQMGVTKVTLIDVREASEITANGIIEGSVSVPVRTLIKSMDKLPADKAAPIIVTCASGHRGMFSMMALQMLGYTNVKNISGGVNAWISGGFPVVKPTTLN
jgi:rhodanese-related sulfurtransferase